jgi:glycosyltransferase involved in cell wall biosynthesis
MGSAACDGRLETRRCSACVLAQHGVPPILRDFLARTPQAVGAALERAGLAGGPITALRLPALIDAGHRHFRALMAEVDHIVALAEWVRNVLRINGVPEEKLSLCRHGFGADSANRAGPRPGRADAASPLRLGYFGRLDPTKGVDVLVEALGRVPDLPVKLEIYGVRQPGSETYVGALEAAAAADPRIMLRPALPAGAVVERMKQCDFVAVPSRWFETGPLVVLEAFAAGTPILGTRLGGIGELVTDGTDGVLLTSTDADEWAAAIDALVTDPARVERLRAGVRPPRSMAQVADEMASLYRELLKQHYA